MAYALTAITVKLKVMHENTPSRKRTMQCKDIADRPLLQFVATRQREKGLWVNAWDFEPPYSDLPDKLFRAKMDTLIRRGLLDGCACGCRGDYEMTDKGIECLRG